YGEGVAKNSTKAAEWFRKAAEQGEIDAQYSLGEMYRDGADDFMQDNTKAVEWFIKAAEQGNISALNHLGDMYWDGIGVTKDIIKVTELYKKAEEQRLS
ncbi:MAG TPA: tetratricopeptide repeat protein, partial [Agitococcus sp.]|nr:tetratricopeptide repeat protein [Agitococcus sp.]